jgi:DeoR family deoxyribose operon repressor
MKLKQERSKRIIEILAKQKAQTVTNLAEELGVSYMTVRRDLENLSQDGHVELLNGVVMLHPSQTVPVEKKYSLADASSDMIEEKERIGRMAASLVKDNDIIIIDTGSTAECLARNLPENLSITILCFTLNTLMEVYHRKNFNIIFAGGYLHRNSMMFESPEGTSLIKHTRATKAFITASGISLDLGVTCSNYYEDNVKRAILRSSQEHILLSDSSKFGKVRSTYFADLEQFGTVVTDNRLERIYEKALQEKGIKVYQA